MSRLMIAAVAVIGLAAPHPAWSKDKADSRIEAAIACATVTGNDARLSCYDRAIGALRLALESGQLIPAGEARKPLALEGVVRSAGPMGFNRFWVILDNGERWQLIATNSREVPPRRGAKIKLRKGLMGAYWFVDPAASDMRATYMGRS